MAIKDAGMHISSADFTYNGGNVTVVIPDGYMIYNVIAEITTVFNGVTPGVVTVGYTGDNDAFLAAATVTEITLGFYEMRGGAGAKASGYRLGTGEDVVIEVTTNNSTQGAGKVFIFHGLSV